MVCVSLPEARSSSSCLQLRWDQRRVFPEQLEQRWPLLPFYWGLPHETSAHRPPPYTNRKYSPMKTRFTINTKINFILLIKSQHYCNEVFYAFILLSCRPFNSNKKVALNVHVYLSPVTQAERLTEQDSLFSNVLLSSRPANQSAERWSSQACWKTAHPTESRPASGTKLPD